MRLAWIVIVGISTSLALVTPLIPRHSESWKRHIIDASSLGADGVRAADANRDGLVDLVAGWEEGGLTRVYLGTRDGAGEPAWKAITVGKSPSVEDAVFFDADGDGTLDVVSSTEGESRKILVHRAPPIQRYAQESEWTTETLYADGSQWMFAETMDVDHQRGMDLIVGGKNEGAAVGWLESPARPRDVGDWKFHRLSEAGWIMSLIVMDMNGDGLPDVLLSDRYGELAGVRWLENPGPGANLGDPWTNHWIGAKGRQVMFIDIADMDGDGVREIVVPYYLEDDFGVSIFSRGDSASPHEQWFEHAVDYPVIAGRPKAVAVGDIDLDGRPDLVLSGEMAYEGKSGIVWLRYRHSPLEPGWDVFDVSGPDGVKFDMNLLLDVDADGDLDVINTEENDRTGGGKPGLGVVWYENPTRRHEPPR